MQVIKSSFKAVRTFGAPQTIMLPLNPLASALRCINHPSLQPGRLESTDRSFRRSISRWSDAMGTQVPPSKQKIPASQKIAPWPDLYYPEDYKDVLAVRFLYTSSGLMS